MCVVFLHYHPEACSVPFSAAGGGGDCSCSYVLVVAVNRDEFFERATKPLGYWGKGNIVLGGERVNSIVI
jgi:hypothetical protein